MFINYNDSQIAAQSCEAVIFDHIDQIERKTKFDACMCPAQSTACKQQKLRISALQASQND